MSLDNHTEDAECTPSLARYYKSRDAGTGIVHVQYEDHWETHRLAGGEIGRGEGAIPAEDLAETDEIGAAEALRLMMDAGSQLPAEKGHGQHTKASRAGVNGIAGWLIFPVLTLCFALILSLFAALAVADEMSEYWSEATTSGRSVLALMYVACVLYFFASASLLVLMYMKKRILPKLMVAFYALHFVVNLTVVALLFRLAPDVLPLGEIISTVWATSIATIVWIPYFLTSKRVKNTFVRGRSLDADPTDS